MNKAIKSYLLLLGHVIIGLCLLLLFDKLKIHWLNNTVLIFIAFTILNILYDYFLKLGAIQKYWSWRKLYHLLPGIVAGAIIALLPMCCAYLSGFLKASDIQVQLSSSVTGILLSFIIVGWEELWFRGVILNYANKYLSPVNISIAVGLLFMLVHVLNPEISLIKKGPALFFAGALLAILYFYYRSIWVPWGVHLGNNFFGSGIKAATDDDRFWGGDGYLSAILLAIVFFVFVVKMKRNKNNPTPNPASGGRLC